jgi:hypothetical protein
MNYHEIPLKMMFHSKEMTMKKIIIGAALTIFATIALGQMANCWQQYVCGGGGCQWVTICR